MKKFISKVKKAIVSTLVVSLCVGSMTVFAALDTQVIQKGANISLKYDGTGLRHITTMSDIGAIKIIGPNYVFSSISRNKSGNANYVKSTIQYETLTDKWITLTTITSNMPNKGAVYSPRYKMASAFGVCGVRFYASNDFTSTQTGFGKTANCTTSLTQGYVFCE